MNSWSARFRLLLVIALFVFAHGILTISLQNTPVSMLVFHGSAALIDWMLALVTPFFLSGYRCKLVQWTMIGSIVGNFAGWLLYMHHVSPVYFNTTMWILTVVQCVCILGPDLRDAAIRNSLVSVAHRFSGSNRT